MKNTESAYIEAGHRYESAKSPDSARAFAQGIRVMLQAETPEDQTEARRLIDQGRAEARAKVAA